jgi:hypothetical protein|nr:MAG TPA: hypothetical protein [Caudoviricetes sp.]DAS57988.1 MAG TPA: hypothetical protein [Caudoviricetes sp.]
MTTEYIRFVTITTWDALMKAGIFLMILNYGILFNWYKYKNKKRNNKKGQLKPRKWYLFLIVYSVLALMYMYTNWR